MIAVNEGSSAARAAVVAVVYAVVSVGLHGVVLIGSVFFPLLRNRFVDACTFATAMFFAGLCLFHVAGFWIRSSLAGLLFGAGMIQAACLSFRDSFSFSSRWTWLTGRLAAWWPYLGRILAPIFRSQAAWIVFCCVALLLVPAGVIAYWWWTSNPMTNAAAAQVRLQDAKAALMDAIAGLSELPSTVRQLGQEEVSPPNTGYLDLNTGCLDTELTGCRDVFRSASRERDALEDDLDAYCSAATKAGEAFRVAARSYETLAARSGDAKVAGTYRALASHSRLAAEALRDHVVALRRHWQDISLAADTLDEEGTSFVEQLQSFLQAHPDATGLKAFYLPQLRAYASVAVVMRSELTAMAAAVERGPNFQEPSNTETKE